MMTKRPWRRINVNDPYTFSFRIKNHLYYRNLEREVTIMFIAIILICAIVSAWAGIQQRKEDIDKAVEKRWRKENQTNED